MKKATLPRCKHGEALADWAGDDLFPSCGCTWKNVDEARKREVAKHKLLRFQEKYGSTKMEVAHKRFIINDEKV